MKHIKLFENFHQTKKNAPKHEDKFIKGDSVVFNAEDYGGYLK
jgi:hypothetical protein